jgi:hypothetical protein
MLKLLSIFKEIVNIKLDTNNVKSTSLDVFRVLIVSNVCIQV